MNTILNEGGRDNASVTTFLVREHRIEVDVSRERGGHEYESTLYPLIEDLFE